MKKLIIRLLSLPMLCALVHLNTAHSEMRKVPPVKTRRFEPAPVKQQPEPTNGDWDVSISPYIWMAAIDGDLNAQGVDAEASLSMGDAVDKGNGAVGFDLLARNTNDGWGLLTQVLYTKLEDTSPDVPGLVFDRAHLTFEEWFITQHLSMNMIEGENGFMDFLVGARVAIVENDIRLRGGPDDRRTYVEDDTWVDPVVGYNLKLGVADNTYFHSVADIGGFDASSSLTWQAYAGLGFMLNDKASLLLGYRALSYDYEKDTFVYDVIMHGPTATLNLPF